MQTKQRNIILGIIGILLIVVVGASLVSHTVGNNKGTLTLNFKLPNINQLQVTLNDKPINIKSTQQTLTVDAKKYTLKASRTGYKPFTTTFAVEANATTAINISMQVAGDQNHITNPNQIASIGATLNNMVVTDVKYFYQNTWAFATLQIDGNTAYVVVDYNFKTNNWDIVSGPGTSFADTSLQNAPADIVTYLQQNDFIYQEGEDNQ